LKTVEPKVKYNHTEKVTEFFATEILMLSSHNKKRTAFADLVAGGVRNRCNVEFGRGRGMAGKKVREDGHEWGSLLGYQDSWLANWKRLKGGEKRRGGAVDFEKYAAIH